jgi:hypothetical protein
VCDYTGEYLAVEKESGVVVVGVPKGEGRQLAVRVDGLKIGKSTSFGLLNGEELRHGVARLKRHNSLQRLHAQHTSTHTAQED